MFEGELFISVLTRGSSSEDFRETFEQLQKPPDTLIDWEFGRHVAKARNDGVVRFFKTDREYLLFIDNDEIFPHSEVVMKLLSDDQDIVSGLYFNRRSPFNPLLFYKIDHTFQLKYNADDYPKNRLVEVEGCGAGLLLIKRHVLEKIAPPWFDYHEQWLHIGDTIIREAWGEDIEFCQKARRADFRVYVDTGAAALHPATIPIGPRELMDDWEKVVAQRDCVSLGN